MESKGTNDKLDKSNTDDTLLSVQEIDSFDNESCRLFKIENYILTLSKDLELPVPHKGKVEELKELHENLIKISSDK